jgi:predicted metal-binding protein
MRSAKTKLTEIVVVCTKCAKRQGLRPGSVRALLKKAGKQAAEDRKTGARRKLRIVESGCLGPCPKRAVAVATGASLAAGRVILLDPGAGPEEALAALLQPVAPRRRIPEFGPNTALAAVGSDESQPVP